MIRRQPISLLLDETGRVVASLDRKRLGANFLGGGGSRSEAFSIREEKVSEAVKLEVYSGDDHHTLRDVREMESPGSLYFLPWLRLSQLADAYYSPWPKRV
jgi:hypothetical protein